MGQTINISPVSRIEGHARISIHLDDAGKVSEARLHVQEFRGFEAFCVGRPFWEMPVITSRICGICPVSHALASAQAGEQIMGIEPPAAATNLRGLLSAAQLILSHSLSFFHLSAPDIVLGLDSPPDERNIIGLARHCPEIIRNGIRLRHIGQQIVNLAGGGHLHPEYVVAGGMLHPLSEETRDVILQLMPEALVLVRFALAVWGERRDAFLAEMGDCEVFSGLLLGLVDDDGALDYLRGNLSFTDAAGAKVSELPSRQYGEAIRETMPGSGFMKPTECISGGESLYRVGPLARLAVGSFAGAPMAEQGRRDFLIDGRISTTSMGYHHARLIEMLYAIEKITAILQDPVTTGSHILVKGTVNAPEGIGVTEAPRGTLIHHYHVDRDGLLTKVNLIVATGHNSRAMDLAITDIARRHIRGDRLTEGLLNRVEHGIRLYDPCLSCATHANGRKGLEIALYTHDGAVIDRCFN